MPAGGVGEGAGGVVKGYLVAGHVVPLCRNYYSGDESDWKC